LRSVRLSEEGLTRRVPDYFRLFQKKLLTGQVFGSNVIFLQASSANQIDYEVVRLSFVA